MYHVWKLYKSDEKQPIKVDNQTMTIISRPTCRENQWLNCAKTNNPNFNCHDFLDGQFFQLK